MKNESINVLNAVFFMGLLVLIMLYVNRESFQMKNILEYIPENITQCNGRKGPRGNRGPDGNNA
jgi:hypothetical protein